MKRPFLILSLSATTSRRWSRLRANLSSNSRKKLTKSRNSPRSLSPTVAKGLRMRLAFRDRSNRLWEIARISKAKSWSMTVWSLKNCKRKGRSFKSCIITQCTPIMSLCMKSPKRISILRKISISRLTNNWRSTSILKVITIPKTQLSKNCLMALPKRESLKLSWRREKCNWSSFKRSMKSKRESSRP